FPERVPAPPPAALPGAAPAPSRQPCCRAFRARARWRWPSLASADGGELAARNSRAIIPDTRQCAWYGRNSDAVTAADSGGLRRPGRPAGPRWAWFGNMVDDGISRRSADYREHRPTPLSNLPGAAKFAEGTNLRVRLTRQLTGDNYPRSQTRRSDYC